MKTQHANVRGESPLHIKRMKIEKGVREEKETDVKIERVLCARMK